MPPRRSLLDRCKSTLKCQKARAKKQGASFSYTAEDLVGLVHEHCRWCRKRLTPSTINFDHIRPVSRGGTWTLENLAAICGSCNRRKGTLDANEYGWLLAKLLELTQEQGSDFAAKNILARLAAGGAWIHS